MTTMPTRPRVTAEQIAAFLAAARETIGELRFAWLATRSLDGGANARAVHVRPGRPSDDEWTRRFLVRRESRKVAEMRAAPKVTLAYQHPSGDAYIALGGTASLIDDLTEMRELWPAEMDAGFPPGFADAHMMVTRLEVDRIELHVRGLTREPFGHGRTMIQRDGTDGWRFIPDY
jgi:general stress protein 26